MFVKNQHLIDGIFHQTGYDFIAWCIILYLILESLETDKFTSSFYFSKSSNFKETNKFTSSSYFTNSMYFSESFAFTPSNDYSADSISLFIDKTSPSEEKSINKATSPSDETSPITDASSIEDTITSTNLLSTSEMTEQILPPITHKPGGDVSSSGGKKSTSLIIGIVVGLIVVIIIVVFIIIFIIYRKRKGHENEAEEPEKEFSVEAYGNSVSNDFDNPLYQGNFDKDPFDQEMEEDEI